MHSHFDLKLYFLTVTALFISMQQVELILRFTLLILSIIYTVYKIIDRFKEQKNKTKDNDNIL
jgi:hypothetical protein